MTSNAEPNRDAPANGDAALDTANPADALPARTTPTWEIEILLSGASVFALFQLYDSLQRRLQHKPIDFGNGATCRPACSGWRSASSRTC